jgi:ankyrin repeat protein
MNSAGMTPLHVCCLFGSEKCAIALIANKADVRAVDKFGR